MRATIHTKVSTLGGTTQKIYDKLVTIHKEVVCLHGLQQQSIQFVKNTKNIQASIPYVKVWTMWHRGAPLDLVKKMKPWVELEELKVRMLIYNNKQLTSFNGSIQASYVGLYSTLDVLVRTHQIPLVDSLTKDKPKNQV